MDKFIVRYLFYILLLGCLFTPASLYAQQNRQDTVNGVSLGEVEVNANKLRVVRSVVPLQTVSYKDMIKTNALHIADVANSFSGITLKDYGGIGGMKTVSVRGMDSHYTSVSYDGIVMSNIQSGQIDLGAFPIDNVAEVALVNAHPTNFLQSARLFSNANTLMITTLLPDRKMGSRVKGKVCLKGGSFGLVSPSIFLMKNIFPKVGISIYADFIKAHGRYSFVQNYGISQNDSSTILHRQNTDVSKLRTEFNLSYRLSDMQEFLFKTNVYFSDRGLPGSIIFYNEGQSKERLDERNIFSQLRFRSTANRKLQYSLMAKQHYSKVHYTDRQEKYSGGFLSHLYMQSETYLTGAIASDVVDGLTLSSAIDIWFNKLDVVSSKRFDEFVYPVRYTLMLNNAIRYYTERLIIGGNLLCVNTLEKVQRGVPSPDRKKLSPTINVAFKLSDAKEYRIRFFYKNMYRIPTFNELYYEDLGNRNLRPENAQLFNIGVVGNDMLGDNNYDIYLSADTYYNNVKDKIVMLPRNGFYWSMLNRGQVNIFGADINLKVVCKPIDGHEFILKVNYSMQRAKDATVGSDNYGEQIPYTPIHSGNASVSYNYSNFNVGFNSVFAGVRWIGQMTDRRNRMKPYSISSLHAQFIYRKWSVKGELSNIFNTQYEIVKFYPMPRRGFRVSLLYDF
ncbi:MAG: hypothetical protein CSA89_00330 [Bacteroidales bacterium]|nr:MAG: hypothetical protein CSA89_00330 [Bacteroidales bacterium]